MTIDFNQILHIDSLGDVVIYLKRHPNWCKGLGAVGCEISPIPLTLPLASNTAYCATAHTRDADSVRVVSSSSGSGQAELYRLHYLHL